jgi:hypothetical protein
MPFDPFGDFATRGYLRNFAGEKDPEAIKHIQHHAFAANGLTALERLKTYPVLRLRARARRPIGSCSGQCTPSALSHSE